MKKLVLAVAILMLFALCVNAQDAPLTKGLVGKGIKAGVTLGNFSGSDAKDMFTGADKKMKIGFGGGAFVTYAFAPMFAVQPEVLYMMKGPKYEATDGAGKVDFKLNYLEIPVLLKVTPEMKGNVKPNFFAGPYLGILLSAKEKSSDFAAAEENGELDIKDQLKSTEFGITFGAGADFVVGKGKVTLDARYDLGLSKLTDLTDAQLAEMDLTDQPNLKTGTFAVFVGYSF